MAKAKPEPSHSTSSASENGIKSKAKVKPSHTTNSASESVNKNTAKVSKDDVRKVAAVAKLNLSEKELEKFSGELERILEAFRELESIETTNVNPSFQPIPMSNVLRGDKIRPSLTQEKAIRNAKNREGGFVKGPRVV
jgi:aspartyl-tRNA(Asn)/glutamyl-tRNA(Gln) amidotransferase subunit C